MSFGKEKVWTYETKSRIKEPQTYPTRTDPEALHNQRELTLTYAEPHRKIAFKTKITDVRLEGPKGT